MHRLGRLIQNTPYSSPYEYGRITAILPSLSTLAQPLFQFLRSSSSTTAPPTPKHKQHHHHPAEERMDFLGGSVPFTSLLAFYGGPHNKSIPPPTPIPCFRTIDSSGTQLPPPPLSETDTSSPRPDSQPLLLLDQSTAQRIYTTMVSLQIVDTIFYEAQRQGRFSFYMTSSGEEATSVASAAALSPDDVIFSQYREQGALMWRGFSVKDMADQCYGNIHDQGKGRQMPIHYGSKRLNFHTISSPLATQLPHAAGAGYALKLDKKDAVSVAYFGEGAASEGDFHAALNFAATLGCPTIFICRNNGWAISTPATEQYRGDGIAGRGPSYGIATVRVDGGDALAVYTAVKEARKIALQTQSPILIEAMSYRSGHHSTSDDSSKYRNSEEMRKWRARDPVSRLQRWLIHTQGWWDEEREAELRGKMRREVIHALEGAAKEGKPPLDDMFSDVYDELPPHLVRQRDEVRRFVAKYPDALPAGVPPL